jgi:similar to stage IV sporulation protein
MQAEVEILDSADFTTDFLSASSDNSSSDNNSSDIQVSELPVAKGFVRGRTWYSAEVTIPLQETLIAATQRQKNGWGIKVGDRVIMITQANSPYEESFAEKNRYRLFSWRNWQFPVEMIKVNYQETQSKLITRTQEEALSLAEEQARLELAASLPTEANVLRQDTVILPADEGFVRVRAQAEVFEDLAVYIQ